METFTKAHQRLPELGGGLRPQPQGSDGMGRKGVHKEDHVLPALRRMEVPVRDYLVQVREVSLLLLVPAFSRKTQIKCAKNILRYRTKSNVWDVWFWQ